MKTTGARLAVKALEAVGVRLVFGVPGVHTVELYDALASAEGVRPVLVTHEGGGAFMADAVSRSGGGLGCVAVVPGAGLTHALSGIAEAYLDGIPLLVVTGGIRRDSGRAYQLHDVDQLALARPVTKGAWRVEAHADVVPTLYEAASRATSGTPGPVLVELAADVLMFSGQAPPPSDYSPPPRGPAPDPARIDAAAELLAAAQRPGIYVGWGAVDAADEVASLAERLGAPVATTLQGLSAFPHDHPLHAGFGFGPAAVPAAQEAFRGCDALLALGCRFSELATGSYGLPVPEALVHVDVDPEVFSKNYPARVAIEADALLAAKALNEALAETAPRDPAALAARIQAAKESYLSSWTEGQRSERVGPGIFFRELRRRMDPDDTLVVDDGNHTFLAAELFPVLRPRRFLSPTDFNCMGYAVPATIGAQLARPEARAVCVVGDGAFLMTGLELLTASTLGLGVLVCVFHDGELAQISQFQHTPLARKTCTVLGDLRVSGVAEATGAAYFDLRHDGEVAEVLERAFAAAADGRPAVVDVRIDYSRKTAFTRGVVKTNLGRFPLGEKLRFVGRALKRHVLG
ncbi:MAG: thiamine pyrophosphate-binding protein [Planctomycetota bacterium]|nr:MAG: thiamine pyrophosphate-binding protein [Planctomycetota bacterium]